MIIRKTLHAALLVGIFFLIGLAGWRSDDGGGGVMIALAGPVALAGRNQKMRLLKTVAITSFPSQERIVIPRNYVYQDLFLYLSGILDVSTGATNGTLAPEQPMSLIRNIKIEGSSGVRAKIGDIKNADMAALWRLSHFLKGTEGEKTVIASAGVQAATPFRFVAELDFELTRMDNPRVTMLNTRELDALDLTIDFGSVDDLISGGDRLEVLSGVSLSIHAREFQDPEALSARYGISKLRYIEIPITAAETAKTIDLKAGHILRGFLIKQYTQASGIMYHTPVETIINSVALVLNGSEKIHFDGWQILQGENKGTYKMEAMPDGYAIIDLAPEGNFDTLIHTGDYQSVELVLNVANVTNGKIRIYPLEVIPSR